jgi:hypothetical protein
MSGEGGTEGDGRSSEDKEPLQMRLFEFEGDDRA